MPKWYRLNSSGSWVPTNSIYRLNASGAWTKLKTIYRLNSSGSWGVVHSSQAAPEATTSPTLINQNSSSTLFYGGDTLTLTRGAYTETTADSNTTYRMRIYKGTNSSLALNDTNWTVAASANYTGANSTSSTTLTYSLTDDDAKAGYYLVGEVRVNNDANTSGSQDYDFETASRVLSRISFTVSSLSVTPTDRGGTFSWTVGGVADSTYIYSQTLTVRETGPSGTIIKTESIAPGTTTTVISDSVNFSPSTLYYAVIEVVANDGWKLTVTPNKLSDNEYFNTLSASPVNTVAPTIGPLNNRGYLPVSTTLTATTGTWSNVSGTTGYAYDWWIEDSVTSITSNTGYISNNTRSYTTSDVSDYLFVRVKATNTDGGIGTATSTTYTLDQAVAVSNVTPTTVTQNVSTNFSFNISHYPTSYTIDWGDSTSTYVSGPIVSIPNLIPLSSVSGNGSIITYTTGSNHSFVKGAQVSISGVNPSQYNISNATILSVTSNQFTISGSAVGTYIGGGSVSYNASTISVNESHTYTTAATRTITVTAQPGNKTSSTNITVSAPSPSASGFDRFNTSTNPSQPSVINFSSSNNQVTSTWSNGSPITAVTYTYSGAGTSGSLTDTTSPFVTSDLTSYSQSGTYTFTVFNYNDNMQVTFSWNQSNARSYRIIYNHSVLGNGFTLNGNNTGSSASATANFTTAGTITWSSLTVYSGDNQTGTSVSYSNPTFSISVPRPESYRQGQVSLTYVLPKLATPTGVNATDNRTDGINITWNAVSGAAYYGVWYGPTPSYDSTPDFQNITTTSYLDTSMGAGVTRNYYVQAFRTGNPAGTKSDWGGPDSGTRLSSVVIPSGGSVSLSGNNTVGSTITASTSGWSGSPTSYDVYITTALSPNIPTSSSTRVASSGGGSSTSYTITSFDAVSPVNVFRAFATASNSAGTSSTVQSSNTITTQATTSGTAPSTPTGLTNTYSSGPSWTGTWNASSGTAQITYYYTLYQSQSNGGSITATYSGSTTSTSFTRAMSSSNGLWAYFTVYASNSAGTSGTATSSWA